MKGKGVFSVVPSSIRDWFCPAAQLRSLQLSLLQFRAHCTLCLSSASAHRLTLLLGCTLCYPSPVSSCLRLSPALSRSVPVQSLRGLKVTEWSKTVWMSLWGSLHQQDILRGSDKQTPLPWTCQSLIPKLQWWNAISHFHYLPVCWIFMTS